MAAANQKGGIMRPLRSILCFLAFGLSALAPQISAQVAPSTHRIVIAAGAVLDGQGKSLKNVRIAIEVSKIVAVNPQVKGPVEYDLRGLTVLPGWIDAHVHITWIFGKDGKNAGTEGTTPEDAYKAGSNAWVTLMAGLTTVQSVGAAKDIPPRHAVAE